MAGGKSKRSNFAKDKQIVASSSSLSDSGDSALQKLPPVNGWVQNFREQEGEQIVRRPTIFPANPSILLAKV